MFGETVMSLLFSSNSVKLTSFADKIFKEIQAEDKKLLGKAAGYVKGKVAAKINKTVKSQPGEPPGMATGNLLKGLKVQTKKTVALVGFVAPAHHANLLEFGSTRSKPRMTKGGGPVRKGVRSTGTLAARPVLFPTFAEEAGAVKNILSGNRLK